MNFEELEEQFITKGSDEWSESIYNEDGDFKYVSMLRSNDDATNLPQVRGTGEEHFKYYIENRLNYCDSKWYAGKYPNDYAVVRIYTPVDDNNNPLSDLAVPANASITVTPYSHMYAGVRYKANGTLFQERLEANETYTFEAPNEVFNDTETAIYGASQLSSLGDLAPLYLGYIDVGNATKLVELKIGDGTPGYQNANLYHLAVGTNRLLKKIDIQNCIGFNQALVLSGCQNIEEIYANGSGITGVELPEYGYLKIMQLPATITNLTLRNQPYLTNFSLEGYDKIKTIQIENCPSVDSLDILDKAVNVERVRLTNVNWSYPDASFFYELSERKIGGIDENGINTDVMWVDGTCHIENLNGEEYAYIKKNYPYLTITYDHLESQLIFMSEDGETELARQTIINGVDGTCPVSNGTIETPTKESTAQYIFTFGGWSKVSYGDVDTNALKKVEGDRIVYVAYTKTIQVYTVTFYNSFDPDFVPEVHQIEYGKNATYEGETPINTSTGELSDFEFIGWKPEPVNIQGNTSCYAQFYDTREITDDWDVIAENCINGTAVDKYKIGSYKPVEITYEDGTSETIDFEVIAHNHDELSDGSYKWEKVGDYNANMYTHLISFVDELYVLQQQKWYKWNGTEYVDLGDLPADSKNGSVIVYNDEIHLLCANKEHYKYNGTEWTSVGEIPEIDSFLKPVIYDSNIYIFNNRSVNKSVYKYNSTDGWVLVKEAYNMGTVDAAAAYNGLIHIISGLYGNTTVSNTYHYTFDGTTFTKLGLVETTFSEGYLINYFDELYFITRDCIKKYENDEWIVFMDCPGLKLNGGYNNYSCRVCVHDGEIYAGVGFTGSSEVNKIRRLATSNWELAIDTGYYDFGGLTKFRDKLYFLSGDHLDSIGEIDLDNSTVILKAVKVPYKLYSYTSLAEYNNELHVMGGAGDNQYKHYKWDGETWTQLHSDDSTLNLNDKDGFTYNGEFHIIANYNKTEHYKWDGTSWIEDVPMPYHRLYGINIFYQGEIHILGGNVMSTKHYKWNGTEWVSVSTLPYSVNNRWDNTKSCAFVYDDRLFLVGDNHTYEFVDGEWVKLNDWYQGQKIERKRAIVYRGQLYCRKTNKAKLYRYTNPRATLTFMAKNLLKDGYKINYSTNKGGWTDSLMRTYCNENILSLLPNNLQSVITTSKKYSDGGCENRIVKCSDDNIWIPSYTEVGGESVGTIKDVVEGQGDTYTIFTDRFSRIKSKLDGKNYVWWLRTSSPNTFQNISVSAMGNFENLTNNNSFGVLPGFCI